MFNIRNPRIDYENRGELCLFPSLISVSPIANDPSGSNVHVWPLLSVPGFLQAPFPPVHLSYSPRPLLLSESMAWIPPVSVSVPVLTGSVLSELLQEFPQAVGAISRFTLPGS